MKYKCLACEYMFESENEIPYCPACENECLEEIVFNDDKYIKKEDRQDHHLHPRFMGNPNGLGEQIPVSKKDHDILHGKIQKWLWDCVREEDRSYVINDIRVKSMEFLKQNGY